MYSRVTSKENRFFYMGIAILLVIMYHWSIYPLRYFDTKIPLIGQLFSHGYIGVDIFLFLSAYGLGYSFENNNIVTFYKRRLLRLLPIYPFFLLLFFLVFKITPPLTEYFDLNNYLLNQVSFKAILFPTDNIEWYVPALLCLYAIYPLIFMLVNKNVSPWLYVLVFVAITVGVVVFHHIINGLLLGRLPIFIMGCIAYQYDKSKRESDLCKIIGLSAIAGVCLSGSMYVITLTIPALLLLSDKIDFAYPKRLKSIVSYLGHHSLEIYLAQQISTKFIMRLYDNPYISLAHSFMYIAVISTILIIIQNCINKVLKKLCL